MISAKYSYSYRLNILNFGMTPVLADHLCSSGMKFIIAPQIRFKRKVGEQATMFFLDPAGNALEFKAFEDPTQLFAK
jgi:extradiol dioxygenase family protein